MVLDSDKGANGSILREALPLVRGANGSIAAELFPNGAKGSVLVRPPSGLIYLAMEPGNPGVAGGVKNTSGSSEVHVRASFTNAKLKTFSSRDVLG